ncbi:MAG: acyclic terpene utilization AtuA family protein [Proteobacteria bacterium]|nr:acyclic terpene utilization AtuA family protein [Pseudomonadota bacterium]
MADGDGKGGRRAGGTNRSLRILNPNGHLGFAPIKTGSFHRGLEERPDMVAADSGSGDVGPVPLATDIASSPREWQEHDLEEMLVGARRLGVPMIVGSAGDTGANGRVDEFVAIVKRLAEKHRIPAFKLGYFYSEVDREVLSRKIARGDAVKGLDGRPDLSDADLAATDHVVAMADVHPFIALLDQGADVIIGGRSSDAAIFAAPAIRMGFDKGLAYYYGKVLECSSFCAEPYAGKESVIGEVTDEAVTVTPMLEMQRCTVASVAGHAMYERANPLYEYVATGTLDMSRCHYEEIDARSTRVTGPKFVPAKEVRFKIEGAGRVGERCVGMAGVRDPHTIAHIDQVIDWSRRHVRERFGETGYELHYNVFGRNGIMGDLEPLKDRPGHELCVVVQAVAPTREMAEAVAITATRQMFYARLPDVKGTAGGVSFLFDEVMHASPACRWTINHTVRADDPLELFPLHMTTAGV